jgi:hypothetical protein
MILDYQHSKLLLLLSSNPEKHNPLCTKMLFSTVVTLITAPFLVTGAAIPTGSFAIISALPNEYMH